MSTPAQVHSFLSALASEQVDGFASMAQLPQRLDEIWDEARLAWPDLTTPAEVFYPYLAARIPPESDASSILEAIDVSGLYLACGCAAQERAALHSFQRLLMPYAQGLAIRLGLSVSEAEDLVGTLSEQLLVGEEARLSQYQGRGSLRVWLKVCVTRMALRQSQKHQRRQEVSEEAQLLPEESGDDLVLAFLRKQYRQPFTEAFREAFQDLSADDRLLMRRKFVDGLTGDELAGLHQVHRATVVRKLARARQQLVDEVRNRLIRKLQVSENEVDSIIRVLRSQLDASFHSLLGITRE